MKQTTHTVTVGFEVKFVVPYLTTTPNVKQVVTKESLEDFA